MTHRYILLAQFKFELGLLMHSLVSHMLLPSFQLTLARFSQTGYVYLSLKGHAIQALFPLTKHPGIDALLIAAL